jgi:alpha-mannosidase
MERYPDYHFSLSQPQVFQYLKEDDPALDARLRDAVIAGPLEPLGALRVEQRLLQNDLLRIEFDAHGEIVSLDDRRAQRELVPAGATLNQLILSEDRPLDWDAWDIDGFYREKAYPLRTSTEWEIVETGPLRAVIAFGAVFWREPNQPTLLPWPRLSENSLNNSCIC